MWSLPAGSSFASTTVSLLVRRSHWARSLSVVVGGAAPPIKQSTLMPPWDPVRLRGGYMVQAVPLPSSNIPPPTKNVNPSGSNHNGSATSRGETQMDQWNG